MDELKNHTLGGFPMTKLKSLMTGTTAIMLLLGVPSWAAEQPGVGIVNNDSIYIDGNSLKIVPGKAKGDASALIKKLDAHAVGAGMIIFRSGDKLYMADAPSPVIQTSSGTDRYGSDRDTSVSAAQAEREWQEYLRSQNRYSSDREVGPTTAQGERERQDWPQDRRRYYGSDRDTSVSAAQAEREWQEYLRSQNRRYGSDREVGPTTAQGERERQDWPQDRRRYYGSDRDTSVSAAQAEREWQEYLRSQNRRYGSDRDTSVSAAQAERDWRDWQEFTRQNPRYWSYQGDEAFARYGSDRDTSVSAAQAEREWQEYLRSQNRRFGSDRIVINDPEYADYKLKKIFADNWTASETR